MSVRRLYYMACDVCLEILDHSDQDSPKDARAYAKAAGWIRRKVPGQRVLEDVCPKCQQLTSPPATTGGGRDE